MDHHKAAWKVVWRLIGTTKQSRDQKATGPIEVVDLLVKHVIKLKIYGVLTSLPNVRTWSLLLTHFNCVWFPGSNKALCTGVQAVGIETGQIIGQLILKSSHYTHFRSFSPKWNSDDGFDLLVHSNPWLWGEICGSSEGRRCSLCGLPVEKLRLCRSKSHVFSWLLEWKSGNNSEAFAEAISYKRMTGIVLRLASYDKTPPWTFISDYPLAPSQNCWTIRKRHLPSQFFGKITWF